jgi:Apg6 BARA domain
MTGSIAAAAETTASHEESSSESLLLPLSSLSLEELQDKLSRLQKRRQVIQETRQQQLELLERSQNHCHDLTHQYELAQADHRAWKTRYHQAQVTLEESLTWNVFNDAFFIWHQGPFATINGVRLGAEAQVSSSSSLLQQQQHAAGKSTSSSEEQQSSSSSSTVLGVMAATVSLPGRYLGFSSSSSSDPASANNTNGTSIPTTTTTTTTTTSTSSSTSASSNNNPSANLPDHNNSSTTTSSSIPASVTTTTTTTTTIRVPWTEINSALGQIVLLLRVLEQTPHANIKFPNHALVPQGSTSKIGIRQPHTALTGSLLSRRHGNSSDGVVVPPVVALYHLYSDDSFQLFGKRNFNLALRALTECLASAGAAIQARDKTIVMPFVIHVTHDNPTAPCTIGGLPVQYGGTDAMITWTRVMKYLLTNVKWCVAFAAKHVDQ